MVTRDTLKNELDHVKDEHLDVLYRIIKALGESEQSKSSESQWQQFITQSYGLFANDPLEREQQKEYEKREALE